MTKQTQTMIDNLHKITVKTLEQWIGIVNKENLAKQSEILKFPKENYALTHGFANLTHIIVTTNNPAE